MENKVDTFEADVRNYSKNYIDLNLISNFSKVTVMEKFLFDILLEPQIPLVTQLFF